MPHVGELRSLDGLYRARFRGPNDSRVGFFIIRSGMIVGANADNDIRYTGACAIEFNGRAIIELRPRNNSSQAIETVTGVLLQPGEEYIFTFTGSLRELGSQMTFKTPFGPLLATIELISAL